MADADKDELRDVRRSERGERFERFVKGEAVPAFFQEDLLPLVSQHYGVWLEKVKAKEAAPEVLKALDDLMAGFSETINLGQIAHDRMLKRRFGRFVEKKA